MLSNDVSLSLAAANKFLILSLDIGSFELQS